MASKTILVYVIKSQLLQPIFFGLSSCGMYVILYHTVLS